MRRIFQLLFIVLLFSVIGYYISINNHNMVLGLYADYTIHVAVWVVLFSVFLFGLLFSELRQFLFHPARFVQKVLHWKHNSQQKKKLERLHQFHEVSSLKEPKQLEKVYHRLRQLEAPSLDIRIQFLEQQWYQLDGERILEGFQQLNQKFPRNLQVLLAYLRTAQKVENWSLVEQLSQEILQIAPKHPDALEAMATFYSQRKEWKKCLQAEIQFLSLSPYSLFAQTYWSIHEKHILQALQETPQLIQEFDWKHVPNQKSFLERHQVAFLVARSKQLQQISQFEKAAKLLQKGYVQTSAPVLLDELLQIWRTSGENRKIPQQLEKLCKRPEKSIFVELALVKIDVQQKNYPSAEKRLQSISQRYSPLSHDFYRLQYRVSLHTKNQEDQHQAMSHLMQSSSDLDSSYTCSHCHAQGTWKAVCPQCENIYTYLPQESSKTPLLLSEG